MSERLRAAAREIFAEALDACSLEQAFARRLHARSPDVLELDGNGPHPVRIDLSCISRVLVIAMGKGAATMLRGLLAYDEVWQDRVVGGVVIAPVRPDDLPIEFVYYPGGHPSPNAASMAAARRVLDMLHEASTDGYAAETFCFFLISGGASAMMELPLDDAISLDDLIATHRALVHSGASITEINCVRKHFSAVKGGRLALAAGSLPTMTFAVSDVPAGQLDVLASGPTLPDSSTVEDCKAVLATYDLLPQLPSSVRAFFLSDRLVESPKAHEVESRVVALLSSDELAAAAEHSARARGFVTAIDNTCDDWECTRAADYLLHRARELKQQQLQQHPGQPVCLISAGEVAVKLPAGSQGEGGRNSHLALYSALALHRAPALRSDESITILSAGSDGIDGNSPAAGAVADAATVAGSETAARAALKEFDSFGYLNQHGAAIVTGPSGNNLRDLRLILIE